MRIKSFMRSARWGCFRSKAPGSCLRVCSLKKGSKELGIHQRCFMILSLTSFDSFEHLKMHAVKPLLILYLTNCVTANATPAAWRAHRKAVAACRNLTLSSTTDDGTTTTISQFPDPSCWDTLGMTDWMTYWNTSTTICTATQSALTPCQCQINEPWATCFMRLTYQGNSTASYACTDLAKPEGCTEPVPGNVVPGPVEIFYGAYSVSQHKFGSRNETRADSEVDLVYVDRATLVTQTTSLTNISPALFRYLAVWYASLANPNSLAAISAELSNTKTSALSASHLLGALIQNYAIDRALGQALVTILLNEPIVSDGDAPTRPTLSNAQELLGQLLQQVLQVLTSDWACGDFQAMAERGMLLDGMMDTTKLLNVRLEQQEKR